MRKMMELTSKGLVLVIRCITGFKKETLLKGRGIPPRIIEASTSKAIPILVVIIPLIPLVSRLKSACPISWKRVAKQVMNFRSFLGRLKNIVSCKR
jgi:hypothetical protein